MPLVFILSLIRLLLISYFTCRPCYERYCHLSSFFHLYSLCNFAAFFFVFAPFVSYSFGVCYYEGGCWYVVTVVHSCRLGLCCLLSFHAFILTARRLILYMRAIFNFCISCGFHEHFLHVSSLSLLFLMFPFCSCYLIVLHLLPSSLWFTYVCAFRLLPSFS